MDPRIIIHSVIGTCKNGLCCTEDYETDWSLELRNKIANAPSLLEMAGIFRRLLMSPNSRYISMLVYFNYCEDSPDTHRHILVSAERWTMVILRDFPSIN